MDELVRVILKHGEGDELLRVHMQITKEAEQRAIELIDQEPKPVSNDRRSDLILQAAEEFPVNQEINID